jgi:uncharacterized protein YggU (UPF0235/DUF167 family)
LPGWARASEGGCVLRVRVQPLSGRDEVGVRGDSLLVRVKATRVGGEANEAARRLLASVLGVAASRVELVRGVRSREKEFRVLGLLPEEVAGRLQGPGSPL